MPRTLGRSTIVFAIVLLGVWTSNRHVAADLADLPTVVDRSSHRASSFDRTGGNNDNVRSFEPGTTHVLLDTDGPGVITHVWMTVSGFPGHDLLLRDLVLRIYWENAKVPSIEVPLGDFFGLGHGKAYCVHSAAINVGANPRALNCYWPMPFAKHARIEVTNEGARSIRRIYYNVDYELGLVPANQGLFHAAFRRVKELQPQNLVGNTSGKDNYVILDTQGQGQYVGCFLFVDSAPGGWWGEGDEMIYLDGEETPSIIGTGTEDYFCNAWGFRETANFPFYGIPLLEKQPDGWLQTTVYRLHVADPVRFKKSIRVTIEHGWPGKVINDYSSVAYWYQLTPVARREPLPLGPANYPRTHAAPPKEPPKPTSFRMSATQVEAPLRAAGVAARAMTVGHGEGLGGGYLQIDAPGKPVKIPVNVAAPGKYRVVVRLLDVGQDVPVTVGLAGQPAKKLDKIAPRQPAVDLGTIEIGEDRTITIEARSPAVFAVDWIKVTPA
ncbi:MAG: DUF2961 domain-containing protein [Pirellulales bacterium]|nr:DUF2961 domain-containing protein [Pirellulales bacterium]